MFYFAAIIQLSVFYNNFENACIRQKILAEGKIADMKKEPFSVKIFSEKGSFSFLGSSPDTWTVYSLSLLLQGLHQLVKGCSGIGTSTL